MHRPGPPSPAFKVIFPVYYSSCSDVSTILFCVCSFYFVTCFTFFILLVVTFYVPAVLVDSRTLLIGTRDIEK